MGTQNPDDHARTAGRLTRLEEQAAFAERAADQVSEEVAALNKRMHEFAMRLARLEDRLAAAQRKEQEPPETVE